METSEEHIRQIKEKTECPRAFQCCRSGGTDFNEVRRLGHTGLIDCEKEGIHECSFGILYGFGRFCACPMRAHIVQHSKRVTRDQCCSGHLPEHEFGR